MDESLFVEKLKELAPSKEDFSGYDVPDEFIEQIIKAYNCLPKKDRAIVITTDPLLALVTNYDCSNVEIGTIKFNESFTERVNYFDVGRVDADILCINKVSKKVQVLDYNKPTHIIWECASNSEKFMEALLICSKYLVSKLQDHAGDESSLTCLKYVNLSSEAAGGEEYREFYKMLLAYFD